MKTNILKAMATIPAIVIFYVLLKVAQYLYVLIEVSESFSMIAIRTIVLLSNLAIAYLSFRRNIIACWSMIVFMSLSGLSIFLFGVFTVPISRYLVKVMDIGIGLYILFGCVVLFKAIKKGEMKGIDSLMKKA